MCVIASFFLFFLCFFMHASSPLPDTVSHSTMLLTQKIEEKHNFKKFGSNERVPTFMRSKALLQLAKSQGSRWPHLNVKEMDFQLQTEDNLSETDYQIPHRKSPIHNK